MERPSLPAAFCQRLLTQMSQSEAQALCDALNDTAQATTSIRLNPFKPTMPPVDTTRVPWCEAGHILAERPHFTSDALLHAGCYYVQEAASMSIELAYNAMEEPPQLLLDLCAAPGGKSTHWRSLMPQGSLLVANEPIRQRAMILRENLQKWGHPDVMVCEDYPQRFGRLTGLFDVIATDVPCSGEGMFRKDPNARSEWSETQTQKCAALQRDIIRDVWPALRGGGYLVYSTCTFNPAENEQNVDWICHHLGAEVIPLTSPASWGITVNEGMLHFFPHYTRGEGFFLALLRKTEDERTIRLRSLERTFALPRGWLRDEKEFVGLMSKGNMLSALRRTLLPAATAIRAAVHTLSTGIDMMQVKGRNEIPAHALALSTQLHEQAFPIAALSSEEALHYLSRQALTLSPEVPKGYVIVAHQGHPLGFVKNIGSRANNLYPAEWRIRHLPL
ncbi:MAG: rRNA cytosine-C5-methyltransferase [Bacteroidaceae bacterium]|nr:rRNA cytosine-C5-methyltransferase [Bacteroidaceae bacterium]